FLPLRAVLVADVLAAGADLAAGMVACVLTLLGGPADLVGSGRIPRHLLLLSRSLLQSVLGRSPRMRGGRASEKILGRAEVPADPAEHPSVFLVFGLAVFGAAGA